MNLMTDIREAAARAASVWRKKQKPALDPLHAIGEAAYQIGYEDGYEAAKAEALVAYAATRLKRHATAPSGADGAEEKEKE